MPTLQELGRMDRNVALAVGAHASDTTVIKETVGRSGLARIRSVSRLQYIVASRRCAMAQHQRAAKAVPSAARGRTLEERRKNAARARAGVPNHCSSPRVTWIPLARHPASHG